MPREVDRIGAALVSGITVVDMEPKVKLLAEVEVIDCELKDDAAEIGLEVCSGGTGMIMVSDKDDGAKLEAMGDGEAEGVGVMKLCEFDSEAIVIEVTL